MSNKLGRAMTQSNKSKTEGRPEGGGGATRNPDATWPGQTEAKAVRCSCLHKAYQRQMAVAILRAAAYIQMSLYVQYQPREFEASVISGF